MTQRTVQDLDNWENGSPEPNRAAQIRLTADNLEMVLAAEAHVCDVVDVASFHVDPKSHVGLMMPVEKAIARILARG